MKKIYFIIILLIICILAITLIPGKKKNRNTITVSEVTHSIFYAPFYVAIENNYFKDEGIDINLILSSGADKVTASVLSKDAQIGLAGAESAIYVYNGNEKDYLQIFAGLTKRDGQFIVGHEKDDNFTLDKLIGKEILVGRKGGMPALNFLNALENENIDPKLININYQVDYASLSGAFIGKTGDYVNLFEPNATKLVKNNEGYVLTSIGKLSGEMPYTTFYARKSYIEDNKDLLVRFNKALNKGIDFSMNNSPREIAEVIHKQFPDNSISELELMIKNYKEADSWLDSTYVNKKIFTNLEDLLIKNKLIDNYVPYKQLVINLDNE